MIVGMKMVVISTRTSAAEGGTHNSRSRGFESLRVHYSFERYRMQITLGMVIVFVVAVLCVVFAYTSVGDIMKKDNKYWGKRKKTYRDYDKAYKYRSSRLTKRS